MSQTRRKIKSRTRSLGLIGFPDLLPTAITTPSTGGKNKAPYLVSKMPEGDIVDSTSETHNQLDDAESEDDESTSFYQQAGMSGPEVSQLINA
jgi:hypothetical protein